MIADTKDTINYALSRLLAACGALDGAAVLATPQAKELIDSARGACSEAVEAIEAAFEADLVEAQDAEVRQ